MKGDSIDTSSLDVVFYPVGMDETGEPVSISGNITQIQMSSRNMQKTLAAQIRTRRVTYEMPKERSMRVPYNELINGYWWIYTS